MGTLGIVILIAAIVALLARIAMRSVQRQIGKGYDERRAVEYTMREEAPWFGKTGLDEETERELPRYLRRELGEFLDEPGALKAADLQFIGAFEEAPGMVYYWKVPYGEETVYAYVEVSRDGSQCTGWANREPPAGKSPMA